jgi:hypothetical protein
MDHFSRRRYRARLRALFGIISMKNYIVLYRIENILTPLDPPFGFQCWAEDTDHAEEQCLNAYPDCDIVWIWQGPEGVGMQPALDDYWATSDYIRE